MIAKSQLKYIQSLGQKKQRDEDGVFIAEGPKLVKELLKEKHVSIKEVFAVEEWAKEHERGLQGIPTTIVADHELEKISQLTTPNRVVAVFNKFSPVKPIAKGRITLVLDTIQDPGNLGTIIRIADWFGISQVVCSPECADLYNPKVVQATMGSIARVTVYYAPLQNWMEEQKGTRIYATSLEGTLVSGMKALDEGIIIIGNESKGIGDDIIRFADEKITIPGKGKAESLNAAVATGIVLAYLVKN